MNTTREYECIAAAICFLAANYQTQPSLEEVAAQAGLSAHHFQRLFTRWAGISPKRFMGCLTADHARHLLRESHTVLDTALEVGLSGPGRLHDLLITHEAMTPGEFKALGSGVEIRWGFHPSPFGACLVLQTARGICGLAFADPGRETEVKADMFARWPGARFVEDPVIAARLVPRIFSGGSRMSEISQISATPELSGRGKEHEISEISQTPIHLLLVGTNFQVKVWEALLHIPPGRAVSYQDIAAHVGSPGAMRAVGSANGRNPISYLIPCHRVLRKSGALGGYHWGPGRKRAMLAWEGAQAGEII